MPATDEGKFKIDGMASAIHCLTVSLKEQPVTPDTGHYHDYIEVLYVLDGDFNLFLNGVEYHVGAGALVLINSREIHRFCYNAPVNTYIVAKFSPQLLYAADQSILEFKYALPFILASSKHQRVFTAEELDGSPVPQLLPEIFDEWQKKEYGYEIAIRALILRLFLWITRYRRSGNDAGFCELTVTDSLAQSIQTATEYVAEHYDTATSSEAARVCGLSYSYFSRCFKLIMNKSFREYVNLVRINESAKLLLTTDAPVSEIAFDAGFSTVSYFIEKFKEIKGMPPKQYRFSFNKVLPR